MLSSKLFITSSLLSVLAVAAPQAFYQPTLYCPLVDSTEEVSADPWQIGASAEGGDPITFSETHEVGTTFEAGGDLGLDYLGLSIGGSFSVSKTVTDGVGEAIEPTCPEGPWQCSMLIIQSMLKVTGHLHYQDNDEKCDVDRVSTTDGGEEGKKFEYQIPIKDDSGNGKFTYDKCTCGNLDGADAPGHPEIICPEDCTISQGN